MSVILRCVYSLRGPLLVSSVLVAVLLGVWSLLPALHLLGLPMLGWSPGLLGIPLFDFRSGYSLTVRSYLASVAGMWLTLGWAIWIVGMDLRARQWRLHHSSPLSIPLTGALTVMTSLGTAGMLATALERVNSWYELMLVEHRIAGASGSYFTLRNGPAWLVFVTLCAITYPVLARMFSLAYRYPRLGYYLAGLVLFDLAVVAWSIYVHFRAMRAWGIEVVSPQFWMVSGFLGSYSGLVLAGSSLLCAMMCLTLVALAYPHYAASQQTTTCARCGYDLRGITSVKCPECGSPLTGLGQSKGDIRPNPKNTANGTRFE